MHTFLLTETLYFFTGFHKFDGLVGSLIVRQPDSKEPLLRLYDFDLPSHSIVVQEWKHVNNMDLTPGLVQRNIVAVDPDSYLINGRGIYMVIIYKVAQ